MTRAASDRARRRRVLGLVGAGAIAAGALALNANRDLLRVGGPDFDFQPLRRPEGFRALRLDGVSGALDPLAALDAAAPPPGPENPCAALFDAGAGTAIGDPAATPVAAFTDYACPYCSVLSPMLVALAEIGAARVVFHEWAVLGPGSVLGARAALAAARQGGHLRMHARLMATPFTPTPGFVAAIAPELGLDASRLERDMRDPRVDATLRRTAALAAQFGMRGTPTTIIGATMVEGAIARADLEALIAIEATRPPPASCAG